MSVVSCLPISRGTVAVAVAYAEVVIVSTIYADGSLLLTWTTLWGTRISPGRGAESSSGWALGLDVLAARVTRGDRSGCDGDERIIVCSEDPGRQRSVLMNGRVGASERVWMDGWRDREAVLGV